jgi:hypothetical protein
MSDFDLREFQQAIREVQKATPKTCAEIINRGGLTAIIGGKGVKGAIQRTPRADRGKINSLTPAQLAGAVKRKNGGKKMTRAEWDSAIKAEKARRRRSIAYTAGPGWHNAAVAFGGKGVRRQPGFPESEAAKGNGSKATAERLIAELENTAPAASAIGKKALQDALNDTARDMKTYAANKLQKTFDKHSSR